MQLGYMTFYILHENVHFFSLKNNKCCLVAMRPKKNNCSFPVTRPTLSVRPTLNVFIDFETGQFFFIITKTIQRAADFRSNADLAPQGMTHTTKSRLSQDIM